ncbi:unnamed protein product [Eruca vesicaria subsp. sativa]|uniref:Uncharacterized protein n=1 Tax=Eruca vesicaria subsp. sativa TaxID=29727 RepID=A0ABC8J7A4_ERUVS|nr:unnamed protein product [Eruca vesicaria subsp. sativa]
MEEEEELLLKSLEWKGKGLIQSAYDIKKTAKPQLEKADERKKRDCLRFYRPKFAYIFCDMDGTLLNSKSQISEANVKALKEATLRGLKVVIATGKSLPGAMRILKMADLAGRAMRILKMVAQSSLEV